jgi:hypothetical protein
VCAHERRPDAARAVVIYDPSYDQYARRDRLHPASVDGTFTRRAISAMDAAPTADIATTSLTHAGMIPRDSLTRWAPSSRGNQRTSGPWGRRH